MKRDRRRPWVFHPDQHPSLSPVRDPGNRSGQRSRFCFCLWSSLWSWLRCRLRSGPWSRPVVVDSRRPLLWLTGAGLLGTLLGYSQDWRWLLMPVGLLLTGMCLWRLAWRPAWLRLAIIAVFILSACRIWLIVWPGERLAQLQNGRFFEIEGQVLARLSGSANLVTALVQTSSGARLAVSGPASQLQAGSIIRARGRGILPQSAQNPGGFSEQQWLHGQGVYLKMRVSSAASMSVLRAAPSWSLSRWSEAARAYLYRAAIELVEAPEAALLSSLLFGDKGRLSDLQTYQFRKAGLMHLTAVSGANVAFWLSPLIFCLRRLKIKRAIRQSLLLLALILFGCLTGWQLSVSRAIVMAAVVQVGRLLHRRADPLNTLALSALLIMIWQPLALIGTSFWLSMAATGGLLIIPEPLGARLRRRWPHAPEWLIELASQNLGVQGVVLPLTSWLGREISLVGLLANVPALPLTEWLTLYAALLLPLVLAGQLLVRVPLFAGIHVALTGIWALLGRPLQGALFWLEQLAIWFSRWQIGRWPLIWLNLFLLAGLFLAVWRLLRPPANRKLRVHLTRGCLALLGLGVGLAGWQFIQPHPDQVWILAVGQGDATLLKTRSGQTILIDGGKSGMGWSVVLPALDALGIMRIDLAIASHGHQDHAGGLVEVMAAGRIRRLALPMDDSDDYSQQLLHLAAQQELIVQRLQKDDTILLNCLGKTDGSMTQTNGSSPDASNAGMNGLASPADNLPVKTAPVVTANAVHPAAAGRENAIHPVAAGPAVDSLTVMAPAPALTADDANEQALHFRLQLQGITLLMLSDMTPGTERALLAEGLISPAAVLKVAHHGSGQTTLWDFLQVVQPRLALISVGPNQYGHPAAELLDRLVRLGCPVYRTDRQGALLVEVFKGNLRIAEE